MLVDCYGLDDENNPGDLNKEEGLLVEDLNKLEDALLLDAWFELENNVEPLGWELNNVELPVFLVKLFFRKSELSPDLFWKIDELGC